MIFNNLTRQFKFKNDKINSSPISTFSLPVVAEDFLPQTPYILLKDFRQFPTEVTSDIFDDTYENSKGVKYLLNKVNMVSYNLASQGLTSNSYVHILDAFRADCDDNM